MVINLSICMLNISHEFSVYSNVMHITYNYNKCLDYEPKLAYINPRV